MGSDDTTVLFLHSCQNNNNHTHTGFSRVCVKYGCTRVVACSLLQVAEVSHLDDEIMALHSEIVELQRSPYARRQGDKMEQL